MKNGRKMLFHQKKIIKIDKKLVLMKTISLKLVFQEIKTPNDN